MAAYLCTKCLFCFERVGEVEACPDCGHQNIRSANDGEIVEYRRNRAESELNPKGATPPCFTS